MDYKRLGLKVGLELHFQINSGKLFCRCSSILRDDEPNIKIKRELRAVVSELGKKDIVAEYEMAKGKYAIYEGYEDTNCLVELDECPPESIDEKALKTALEISILLNCKIFNRLIIMRKQVLDYSNTSSFQRTGLVAINGYIKTKSGKVEISTICIEEDAARKMKEEKDYIVYRLDRLGIPLIEVVTAPDIKTPEQAKEVAEYIGMVVKSTGKKRAGIGSIRQDINVSIANGARVEIKGVQDLKSIPNVIENEVKRQLNLIEQGNKVVSEVRKANLDNTTSYLRPMPGSARMYPESDIGIISITKDLISKIKISELISEKVEKLEEEGLNADLARELIKNKIDINKYKFKLDKNLIAKVLIDIPKEIKTRFNLNGIKEKDLLEVLKYIEEGRLSKDDIIEALVEKLKKGKINLFNYRKVDVKNIEREVEKIIEKNKGASFNAIMGECMKVLKGKIDGKTLGELIKKRI